MIKRQSSEKLKILFENFKAVYIAGARQVGKTTLIEYFAKELNAQYFSLDDPKNRKIISLSPEYFLENAKYPLFIDEIQKVPELLDYIKLTVDKRDKNGQFVLTGSSNIFHNPQVYESLSGRLGIMKLYPFSVTEFNRLKFNLLQILFEKNFLLYFNELKPASEQQVYKTLLHGLFPVVALEKTKYPNLWFESYVETRLKKDLYELTEKSLHKQEMMSKLLKLLAGRVSSLLNVSHLAQELKINYRSARNYLTYLQDMYLIELLQPYAKNIGKQIIKTPKIYFVDTGIISYLLDLNKDNFNLLHPSFGYLLENHIFLELVKNKSALVENYQIFYFRDKHKNEVDFVVRNHKGELIGIEVKTKSNVKSSDLSGLRVFSKEFDNIKNLFVFYGGNSISAEKVNNRIIYLIPYGLLF